MPIADLSLLQALSSAQDPEDSRRRYKATRMNEEASSPGLVLLARTAGPRAWLLAFVAVAWVAGTLLRIDDVWIFTHYHQRVGTALSESALGVGMSVLFAVVAVREFRRSR